MPPPWPAPVMVRKQIVLTCDAFGHHRSALLALFADCSPAIPGGHGAVGPEPFAQGLQLLRRREPLQAVGQCVTCANAVVPNRPDVEPTQLKDQEHLRGPLSDATDDRQRCDDVLVRELADALQSNGSIHDLRREISDGTDLAPRESYGAKLSGGKCEDGVGREISVEQGEKSPVDGGRRCSGKLLIEDALGEGGKVRCVWSREAEGRITVYQLRHDPITARHFYNRCGKGIHHVG